MKLHVVVLAAVAFLAPACGVEDHATSGPEDNLTARAETAVDRDVPTVVTFEGARYEKVSSLVRVSFGHVALDPSTRQSATLELSIPKDAVSFAVHVLDDDGATNPSFLYELVDPRGRAVISPEPEGVAREVVERAGRGQGVSPNAVQWEIFPEISSTLVPNGPDVEVVPGTWKFVVAEEELTPIAPRTKTVVVVIKRASAPSPADAADMVGVVRARFRVAPDSALDGQPAPKGMTDGLSELRNFYGAARLAIDVVGIDPLDEEANAAALTTSANAQLIDLMRAPKDDGVISVNFLRPSNYVSYAGIATHAGASGPWTGEPSSFGGVIIQADPSRQVEHTIAHELGHHLGLDHTNVDHLSDTSTFEHLYYGAGGFEENLMTDGRVVLEISDQQKRVVHANPAVAWYRRAP